MTKDELDAAVKGWSEALGVAPAKEHPLIDAVMTLPAFQEAAASMPDDYTAEERAAILDRMQRAAERFYRDAIGVGCHAFIEFTGLMREFINACQQAEANGKPWVHANGHAENLQIQDFQVAYIREKLGCIYGDQVLIDELE